MVPFVKELELNFDLNLLGLSQLFKTSSELSSKRRCYLMKEKAITMV